ncbi:glycosyltransferase involved in cell wall biosynthesis [Gelidibacter algens]|uniref:Glycosyltransferase involved in cell wall biosynthesis n=1 Tax=Gelidibacter algens TaxID=49280 RepID=A0A1A7QRH8_9FLAO|nr:glycosyltransferase family 4 protein [Gelidibacter algens]OBX21122.1 glycosyl transferase family 1 [Gelidibacter algens]RAJ25210.1 glycosyltransferase involved in cell wall biosynthesis [Gelidibacter algens]
MKNLLYVGNHLQNSQSNASYSAVLGPLFEQSGYEVQYTSSKTNKVRRLWEMLWTTYRSRKKTDLVLIDTYSTQNFQFAVLVSQLCRLLQLRYVPILHGGNLPHRLNNSPKLSKILFKNAYANVSPSLYLKDSFAQFGYENVVYVPNTIALKHYPFSSKTYDYPKLLWVRSFSEIYNPTLAIEVLHELQARGFKTELCMVGPDADGSLAKVKALATSLNVHVTYTGKLTKDAWIALSENYNVFINTTNFDNMPVSVIEAMALGLPVVSTNVGGMPYLISDGLDGLLVPPNDKEAMADAIGTLFKELSRTEAMVIKARGKVEQFDWKYVGALWDEVLGCD